MLNDIEKANMYFLKSIDDLQLPYDPYSEYTSEEIKANPTVLDDSAVPVGSVYVMNEVAVYMTDDDVLATTGSFPERCVIVTTLSRDKCKEIVRKGLAAYDKKLRGNLQQ